VFLPSIGLMSKINATRELGHSTSTLCDSRRTGLAVFN
jgi:hypothetical protein